jgi:limonene-1,2-epoxide hydrolase
VDPESAVRRFCDAIQRRDPKELTRLFTEDAVYHNIPIAPVVGHAAIEGLLAQFLAPASAASFEVRALAVTGDRVLTERVDRFTVGEKHIELPVMGIFEVTPDGRIRAWRDYFDLAQYTRQVAG